MATPFNKQPHWTLRPGVSAAITVGVFVALATIVLIVYLTRSSGSPVANPFPSGIISVTPTPQAQSPRQGPIGARLASGWSAQIIIDNTPIPDGQLTSGTRELNEFFFTPGEGKAIESIQPGETCAEVIATPIVDTNSDPTSFVWCFTSF